MYRFLILFIALLLFACRPGGERSASTEMGTTASNNIRHHLSRVAAEISDGALMEFETLASWERVRKARYDMFGEMISLTDVPLHAPRSPLNVRVTGTIQKGGYRIEKLYYESLPGLYVPANLYIPDGITEPTAAILYVCGHSRTQKVHYQAHARKFAQLGFVCLIIETIQWGEVYGDHWGTYSRGWFHWISRGYNPGGVEVWNAIRGLDLLAERQEVDPEKLGVTGISGGGAQTFYIAAIDPRIKAAAPVCGASTLESHLTTRTIDGHCDCMMHVNTYLWDFQDIGALIAPRPLLIAQADRDGLNTIESVREIYEDLKRLYDLYGVPENVSLVETPGGHSYHQTSRTRIFSFFIEHLMGRQVSPDDVGDIDESPEAQLSVNELMVYVDGPPADDRTTTIQDSFVKVAPPPAITSLSDLETHARTVRSFLVDKTFRAFPSDPVPFDPVLEYRTLDGATYGEQVFSFNTEKDWRLKLDVRWRNPNNEEYPLMIVLRSPDEERWASEGFISGLTDHWNIAYYETRGVGEYGWSPELQWHVRRAAAWTGRTIASMRVYDVLRAMEFARTLDGVSAEKIGIAARGEMAAVALYAALLDERCDLLILQNPPDTQDEPSRPDGHGETIEMLNSLRITDVNRIPALLSPTEIVFIGEIPESYRWAAEMLQTIGSVESIRAVQDVSEW